LLLTMPLNDVPSTSPQVTHEEKAKGFGELVEAYAKGRKVHADIVYNWLQKHVKKEKAVLDLGCGTGISTIPLFSRFDEVRGCDHDPKMLAIAKKDPKYAAFFDEGSAYKLPYKDKKFGAVTMFASFHWFSDKEALAEISRVLEDDGFVYIVERNGNPGFSDEARKMVSSIVGPSYVKSKENYNPVEALTQNGFKIVDITEFATEDTFTVEEALQYFQSRSDWKYVKKAGKEQETLAKLRELCEKNANEKGIIVVPNKPRSILAQKANS
jgi:ubiquinone/menaquinone biosynthesis C-methylase UbiE